MYHTRQHQVVNQARRAKYFLGQVAARRGTANDAVLGVRLGRECRAGVNLKIDQASERTITGAGIAARWVGVDAATLDA